MNGFLVRKDSIDWSVQKFLLTPLQIRLLHQVHHSNLPEHPWVRRMYDSLRWDRYWPHMVTSFYKTVKNYCQWARMGTKSKHQRQIELFSPAVSLLYIAIYILVQIKRTKKWNLFVVILTNRYSKLKTAISTAEITSTQLDHVFFHEWAMCYFIHDVILSYTGQQFVGKFFKSLCIYLGLKKLSRTAFQQQTNGQVEGYNKNLVSRLQMCIAEYQQNLEIIVQPITFAYNCDVHC